jgi:hypothetical protein
MRSMLFMQERLTPCRACIPVVTSVLEMAIQRKVPSWQEGGALMMLTGGVVLAVWQGSIIGSMTGIALR